MSRQTTLKKITPRLAVWTAAWVISTAIASFGSTLLWPEQELIKISVLLLNLALGVGMIEWNRRYILALDELQQKIYLQAAAISLGVAIIGGIAYSLADITNVIPMDAEISLLIMLIGITYLISLLVGMRSYR